MFIEIMQRGFRHPVFWIRPVRPLPSYPLWPLIPVLLPQPPPAPATPPPAPKPATTPSLTPSPLPPQTTNPRGDNGWAVLIWKQESLYLHFSVIDRPLSSENVYCLISFYKYINLFVCMLSHFSIDSALYLSLR